MLERLWLLNENIRTYTTKTYCPLQSSSCGGCTLISVMLECLSSELLSDPISTFHFTLLLDKNGAIQVDHWPYSPVLNSWVFVRKSNLSSKNQVFLPLRSLRGSEEGLTLAFWKSSEEWQYTRITCLASKLTSLKGTTLIYMILVCLWNKTA